MAEEEKKREVSSGLSGFLNNYRMISIDDTWNISTSPMDYHADISQKPVEKIREQGKKLKVFYVGTEKDKETAWMTNVIIVDDMKQCDMVLFGNGPFLNHNLWREEMLVHHNLSYKIDDDRDISDIKVFIEAMKLDKKIIGIGRGAYLCCVMSGGSLIQYVDRPAIYDINFMGMYGDNNGRSGAPFVHDSNRMQQVPFGDYTVIAKARNSSSHHIYGSGRDERVIEGGDVLICHYKNIGAIGIDGLPWARIAPESYITFCNKLISIFDENMISFQFGNHNPFDEDNDSEDMEDDEWDDNQAFNDDGEPLDSNGNVISIEEAKVNLNTRREMSKYFEVPQPVIMKSGSVKALYTPPPVLGDLKKKQQKRR